MNGVGNVLVAVLLSLLVYVVFAAFGLELVGLVAAILVLILAATGRL